MRACLHLGTRACRTALADCLRQDLEPVTILVPVEPALLHAAALGDERDRANLRPVAQAVADQARTEAQAARRQEAKALGEVFGQGQAAKEPRLEVELLPDGLGSGLASELAQRGIDQLWVARAALEQLDLAGIDLAGLLARGDIELEAR